MVPSLNTVWLCLGEHTLHYILIGTPVPEPDDGESQAFTLFMELGVFPVTHI